MKFSIITINYNNAEGLCKTMDSVFIQNCTDYEFIVIDGGSTDKSVNFIQNGGG
ncbi:glycosyltransferase [Alloprevotella tannerae]